MGLFGEIGMIIINQRRNRHACAHEQIIKNKSFRCT